MSIIVKRSDRGFHDYKEAEETVNERVSQLESSIFKNQGEIILLYRNIYGGSTEVGCFGGGISRHVSVFDAGVISGDLEKVDFKKAKMMAIRDIPTPDLLSHYSNSYHYPADVLIPVDREFHARGALSFDVEVLKKTEKGKVGFSRLELIPVRDIAGYTRDPPFLTEFGIFVGEKEIKNFVYANAGEILGYEFSRDPKERIEELFKLIKDPKESKKIIAEDLFRKRPDLTKRLLGEVSSLANLDIQLSQIRPEVMKISFYYVRDQDGSRDMCSSKGDLCSKYLGLRRDANNLIKTIDGTLQEADSLDLSTEDFKMSGISIGFPSDISSQKYISFVDTELVPRVKNNLGEMDKHLTEAKKKAK